MEELGKGKYLIDHLLWVGESELKNQEKFAKSAIEDLKQYSSMVNRALDIAEITMAVDEIRKYPKKTADNHLADHGGAGNCWARVCEFMMPIPNYYSSKRFKPNFLMEGCRYLQKLTELKW